MRKYKDKSNLVGKEIGKIREEKNISREELAEKLQLMGLNIDRTHILRIEKNAVILKDFELIAISKILEIDLNQFKEIL